ncbi:MAG: signal recognition particle-docking protein FtsY [Alphaproteobacteria bacterium]|nr:signal recognition particle-docking protein FtsY [Alphaproteobacteria bacterium]
MSWLEKLKLGMKKTARLFSFSKIDFESLEELEDALLMADVGVLSVDEIINEIKTQKPKDAEEMKLILKNEIINRLKPYAVPLEIENDKKPFVVLMVGVNGAGKTTTIGKLGSYYKSKGYQVSFAAGDTFRAGAVDQLKEWGIRNKSHVYTTTPGGDAAALVYDAIHLAKKNKDDVLFIDTAGRLQNRADLMEELKKINRVIKKADPTAPHATLLVLDATVGQNALVQVEAFSKITEITGLIMTKLDGTAKGGILLALSKKFKLPIHAIGVGEQIEDLSSFTAEEYANSLLG